MSDVVARWAEEDLEALSAAGLRRALEPLASPQGPRVRIGGQELVNLSSNDYLGLANDPALADAVRAALHTHGVGSGASRLIVGDTSAHGRLEQALAAFLHAPAARLFNSGWAANTGVIPALCGPDDVVFSDELNHASLVDGCRLSRARVVVYPHGDVGALDALLGATPVESRARAERSPRRLVVTDAVFSMDGDPAPLAALAAVCRTHGAGLLVDEAHALGVLGPSGAGLCELEGVEPDVRVGTLSKALGGAGGFIAGSDALCELVVSRARPLVFSTALPALLCAAGEAALACLQDGERRERLWANVRRFSAGLRALGLPAGGGSAVFSVVLGTPERALAAAAELRRRGVLAKPIRPPTVPEGTSRLRCSLSAAHTVDDVNQALEALGATLAELSGRPAPLAAGVRLRPRDEAPAPPQPVPPPRASTPDAIASR